MNSPLIYISAGEASGDILGAELITELQKKGYNNISVMGGTQMQACHPNIVVDSANLGLVGIWEILRHLPQIVHTYLKIRRFIKTQKPAVVVLIDYPDFHFLIAKLAKKYGARVLYYVSPQLWAWRPKRIHFLKKNIDHMAVLFDFEEKIYTQAGIPVTVVGHPLWKKELTQSTQRNNDERKLLNNPPLLGLFPGSRTHEIQRLLPVMIDACRILQEKIPGLKISVMLAQNLSKDFIKNYLSPEIKLVTENKKEFIKECDAIIATSGTVTLEIALQKTPLVVIYKLSTLTYWLAKILVKTKIIGLCNIIAQENVALELIQNDATPEKIAEETFRLLTNQEYHAKRQAQFSTLQQQVQKGGGSLQVADLVMRLTRDTTL